MKTLLSNFSGVTLVIPPGCLTRARRYHLPPPPPLPPTRNIPQMDHCTLDERGVLNIKRVFVYAVFKLTFLTTLTQPFVIGALCTSTRLGCLQSFTHTTVSNKRKAQLIRTSEAIFSKRATTIVGIIDKISAAVSKVVVLGILHSSFAFVSLNSSPEAYLLF